MTTTAIVPQDIERDITPMDMLRIALTQGADIEKLQQLMEFKERWEANQARKDFDNAMAEFKANSVKIAKNETASFETQKGHTEYRYSTLDNVNASIVPALSAVGINHRWDVKQAGQEISVTCILKHRNGHSETTTLTALADTSGGKNAIQSIGSAVTYLERYTLLAATGLAVGGTDDDGNSSSPHPATTQAAPVQARPTISGEPDIKPRSQKNGQPTAQPAASAPAATQPHPEPIRGEVVEASISKPQSNRYFAIMKSAGVSDDQAKDQLASLGYDGHRDAMPRRIYEAAVDLLDPQMKFHQNKPKG